MAKIDMSISAGFYVSDSAPIASMRCVNFYPNVPQAQTITQDNLFGTPGIVEVSPKIPNVFCRGAQTLDGVPYFVIGDTLYRLNRSFVDGSEVLSLQALGGIEGVNFVYMASNGTQLCITAVPDVATPGKSYIFTESPDTLAEITDINFDGPAIGMAYANGYFVFVAQSGKKFFNSPLNDGLGSYDALDFSTAEADPDAIVGLIPYKGQLYVLGTVTIQPFRDIGRTPSPYSPITSAVIDVGVSAPHSVQLYAGSFAFVGAGKNETPSVWAISGLNKRKISTTAIDNVLSDLTQEQIANIHGDVYSEDGAFFYLITLPETTFVFDVSNNRWHERTSIKKTLETKYRATSMVQAYGRIFVGDIQDGRVGYLSRSVFTEYSRMVRRFVTSRPFDNNGDPIQLSSIEAVIESGVGLPNDISVEVGEDSIGNPIFGTGGLDPVISMSRSSDGGKTFFGLSSRSMGKIGARNQRAIWNRLGRYPDSIVIKLEISSPTKATIIKVRADA
jgi:hypothetical protein